MGIAQATAAALALLLAACQSSPDEAAEPRFKTPDKGTYTAQPAKAPPSPGAAAPGASQSAKVTVQDDLFNNRTNYYTNTVSVPGLDVQASWRLTGQKSHDGGGASHHLRVYATYKSSHWNNYVNANDGRLAPLEITQADRSATNCDLNKIDCTYSETLDIVLSESQLRDGLASGLVITVTPSTAPSLTLTVPPLYVRALLEKMA
jgi:hypothetical protein